VGMVGNIYFELFISIVDGIIKISIVEQVLLGFILGYLSLWLINTIYKIFKKKDGIGGGDFILFGGIGAVLGPFILPLIMLMGSLFSIAFYILNIRKNIGSNEIPLGSGLICGFFMYVIIKFFELNIFLVVL
jgi:leader peptidase (prepilin peptidase)/N-methyltransferase